MLWFVSVVDFFSLFFVFYFFLLCSIPLYKHMLSNLSTLLSTHLPWFQFETMNKAAMNSFIFLCVFLMNICINFSWVYMYLGRELLRHRVDTCFILVDIASF